MQGDYPRQFGPYELLRSLGRGGMAEVFLAQAASNTGDKRLVALKRMHAGVSEDHSAVEMLVAEARLAMRFDHPNIASVFELGCHDTSYYFLMEYVDGIDVGTLQNIHEAMGQPMDRRAVARIALGIARGLNYAHELHDEQGRRLGIVHRDVSPQNVLVNRRGHVKLIDFGVAKVATRIQQTMAGIIKGKYAYMSPEQASAEKVDARSDVFSLGICMYELLTARALFRGPNMNSPFAILRAVREDPIAGLHKVAPRVGPDLSAIVHKALERDIERRYISAAALADDLDEWLAQFAPKFDDVALNDLVTSIVAMAPKESVPQRAVATPPVARMTGKEFMPSNLSVVARSPLEEDDAPTPGQRPARPSVPRRGPSRASHEVRAATIAAGGPKTGRPNPAAAPPLHVSTPHGRARSGTMRPSRKAVLQFLWVGLTALIFALGWSVIATLKKLGKI